MNGRIKTWFESDLFSFLFYLLICLAHVVSSSPVKSMKSPFQVQVFVLEQILQAWLAAELFLCTVAGRE